MSKEDLSTNSISPLASNEKGKDLGGKKKSHLEMSSINASQDKKSPIPANKHENSRNKYGDGRQGIK